MSLKFFYPTLWNLILERVKFFYFFFILGGEGRSNQVAQLTAFLALGPAKLSVGLCLCMSFFPSFQIIHFLSSCSISPSLFASPKVPPPLHVWCVSSHLSAFLCCVTVFLIYIHDFVPLIACFYICPSWLPSYCFWCYGAYLVRASDCGIIIHHHLRLSHSPQVMNT